MEDKDITQMPPVTPPPAPVKKPVKARNSILKLEDFTVADKLNALMKHFQLSFKANDGKVLVVK